MYLNNEVHIFQSNTFVAIPSDDKLNVRLHNSNDTICIADAISHYLDERSQEEDQFYKYYMYNSATKMVHFPANFFSKLVKILHGFRLSVKIIHAKRLIQSCKQFEHKHSLNEGVSSREDQVPWIKFLMEDNESLPMRLLDIQTGKGKAQPLDAKILTPEGFKQLGSIGVDDIVIAQDGKSAKVISEYPQGVLPMFKIYTEDGRVTEASGQHLWKVYLGDNAISEIIDTEDMMNLIKTEKIYIDLYRPYSGNYSSMPHFNVTEFDIAGYRGFTEYELSHYSDMIYNSHPVQRSSFLEGMIKRAEDSNTEYHKYDKQTQMLTTFEKHIVLLFQQLIWSLGGTAVVEVKRIDDKDVYTVIHKLPSQNNPSHLQVTKIEETVSKECKCIMIDHPSHLYVTDDYIVTHNTYCASEALLRLGYKTLIVSPSNLVTQWQSAIKSYSTISDDNIYIVQGSDSIRTMRKLLQESKFDYDVVIVSINTISSYITKKDTNYEEDFPQCLSLLDKVGFGVKIIDELHMNFHANILVDLNTNIPINVYLTATPGRSSKKSKQIFDTLFPSYCRFNFDDYDKYLLGVEVGYTLPNTHLDENYFIIPKIGYSQHRYEKYISKRKFLVKYMVDDIIVKYLDLFLVKPNEKSGIRGKCLLYISKVAFAEILLKELKNHPYIVQQKLRVCTFLGGDSSDKPDNHDVIITTFGSAGTGKDIGYIRSVFSLVSFASEIVISQLSGRVRKKDMGEQYVVFFYNKHLSRHTSHKRGRRRALQKVTKEIKEIEH